MHGLDLGTDGAGSTRSFMEAPANLADACFESDEATRRSSGKKGSAANHWTCE